MKDRNGTIFKGIEQHIACEDLLKMYCFWNTKGKAKKGKRKLEEKMSGIAS